MIALHFRIIKFYSYLEAPPNYLRISCTNFTSSFIAAVDCYWLDFSGFKSGEQNFEVNVAFEKQFFWKKKIFCGWKKTSWLSYHRRCHNRCHSLQLCGSKEISNSFFLSSSSHCMNHHAIFRKSKQNSQAKSSLEITTRWKRFATLLLAFLASSSRFLWPLKPIEPFKLHENCKIRWDQSLKNYWSEEKK
jgi:hypothetical protein